MKKKLLLPALILTVFTACSSINVVYARDPSFGPPSIIDGMDTGYVRWDPVTGETYSILDGSHPDEAPPGAVTNAPAAESATANQPSSGSTSTSATKPAPKEPEITITEISGNYRPSEDVTVFSDKKGTNEVGTLSAWTATEVTGETSNGLFRISYNDDYGYVNKETFVTEDEYNDAWEQADPIPSTCVEHGKIVSMNTLSGETKEQELPLADHQYEVVETIDPTCTEDGKEVLTCSVCGDTYENSFPSIGHDEGEWVVTVEPKAFSEGLKERKCTVCGYVLESQAISQTFPIPLTTLIIIICCASVGIVVFVVIIVLICRRRAKSKQAHS